MSKNKKHSKNRSKNRYKNISVNVNKNNDINVENDVFSEEYIDIEICDDGNYGVIESETDVDYDNDYVDVEEYQDIDEAEEVYSESIDEDFSVEDNKVSPHTTKIRIDRNRLTDYETLDTSFLEGSKKVKIADDEVNYNKNDNSNNFNFKIILILLVIIIGILMFIIFEVEIDKKNSKNNIEKSTAKKVEKVEVVKVEIDDNYLFLGDSITEYYDLDKYYSDMPVVNSGVSGYTTRNILDNMKKMAYDYNPSKVFIMIGTNDFTHKISNEEIVENIEKIINGIQENRPYCKIYLETIYPINNGDDDKIDHEMVSSKRNNDTIIEVNKELEKLAKKEKITFINIYDKLLDDDGNLDVDYTTEGLHLSDEGYEVVTKEIKKYIEE